MRRKKWCGPFYEYEICGVKIAAINDAKAEETYREYERLMSDPELQKKKQEEFYKEYGLKKCLK